MVIAGYFGALGNGIDNKGEKDVVSNVEREDMAQKLTNMFTLKVYAAESQEASEDGYVTLEPGKSFVLRKNEHVSFVIDASETGCINYCISLPLLCEGENVERITYSINKGYFQIVEPLDSTIILDGECEGTTGAGGVGGEESETGDLLSVARLYKSFSVAYDKQSDSRTWINICNETELSWNTIFGDDTTLEDEIESYDAITKDVLITYTVHYTDGTSEDAYISIGGGIVTPEPIGNSEIDNSYVGFELRYEQ